DLVLGSLPGADGLKTGHTDAAGYGITISAMRENTRFILVLNGLRYPQYNNDYFPNIKRAEEAGRVMDMAFREFRRYPITATNQVLGQADVVDGAEPNVPVTPREAIAATMQVDSQKGVKTVVKTNPGLAAPIAQGQRVGTMTVTAPDFPPLTVPVYAAKPVDRANIFFRTWNRFFGMHCRCRAVHHPGGRGGWRQIHPGQALGMGAGSQGHHRPRHARTGRLAGSGRYPQSSGQWRAGPLGRAHRNASGLCRPRRS